MEASLLRDAPRPTQITMSPYYGRPYFSGLSEGHGTSRAIDLVSVADILRKAFVYPPHSIFDDIKLVTFGFSPGHDMARSLGMTTCR